MRTGKDVQFKTRPLLLAAWPGLGNAGILAVNYLKLKLGTKPLATIDMSSMFTPQSITVQHGIVGPPQMPENSFVYREDPDLILFESDTQFSGKEGIFMINALLEVAHRFKVPRIFTIDGLHEPTGHPGLKGLFCASNNDDLLFKLEQIGIIPMHEGHITGPSGILPGMAKSRGMEAACLLAPIPSYAENIPYPRAALEIVKVMKNIIGIPIDLSDIIESVKKMENFLRLSESDEKGDKTSEDSDGHLATDDSEKSHKHILEKIEKLFAEVQKDKSKAGALKKELDRWKLFDVYEKRFLDIFRNK